MIIAVHEFGSLKKSHMLVQIAPVLRKNRIWLVAFDLPGHGER